LSLTLESTVSFINASLAPAVVFTGVGLLLAGLQSKYSTLVATLRQMHVESLAEGTEDLPTKRKVRLRAQMESLMRRARLVRNSICAFYLTIFFLVCASLGLGLPFIGVFVPPVVSLIAFVLALLSLFSGILIATWEALLSFQIVCLEAKEWRS
jgi:hypothetical protein|tara:strand:+ start:2355 stop:2816 length:462 start_codon:yes stop_codon:yes gene_type:complete